MLSSGQTITTCQRNISQHCWAQHVACVWPPCCDMLGVVGSSLKLVKFEPTTPNMSQHGGQTHATCCSQQCCDMLCWHVAIVWPGLYSTFLWKKKKNILIYSMMRNICGLLPYRCLLLKEAEILH